MRDAIVLCNAEQRTELGAQFPRWRTLAALLINDLKTQMQLPERPHPDTLPISQVTWQMYNSVAIACKPVTICARRGCNNTGTARCSMCKIIRYCGAKCQKGCVAYLLLLHLAHLTYTFSRRPGTGKTTNGSVAPLGMWPSSSKVLRIPLRWTT